MTPLISCIMSLIMGIGIIVLVITYLIGKRGERNHDKTRDV